MRHYRSFLTVVLHLISPFTQVKGADYGTHEPNGLAAVRYLYSPEGTWTVFRDLRNMYKFYATEGDELTNLMKYANGSHFLTCPDRDDHAYMNLSPNNETDTASGTGFMWHNGRGQFGTRVGDPFSLLMYETNLMASYMASVYGMPNPSGYFHNPKIESRYQILNQDNRWYPENYGLQMDERAFDGMFRLAKNDFKAAVKKWHELLVHSGAAYDHDLQRYVYPEVPELATLALWKFFAERLVSTDIKSINAVTRFRILQHSMSMHSILRSAQESSKNGTLLAWRTLMAEVSLSDPKALFITTEPSILIVLALGAGAMHTFEADSSPMIRSPGTFVRPYGALSAVRGKTATGIILRGPNINLAPGDYLVEFYLRSGEEQKYLATRLDVFDANVNQTLGEYWITAESMPKQDGWGIFGIGFKVRNPQNMLEFRITWNAYANLDISMIRVRQ